MNVGDTITVDYTPGGTSVQDSAGNTAAALAAQYVATAAWQFVLYDLNGGAQIAEVTQIAMSAKIAPRLNRPLTTAFEFPADSTILGAAAADGDPNLWPLSRSIKAYRNGTLRAHTIVTSIEFSGDADKTTVQANGVDALYQLQKRPVRDATGNLSDPTFASPITAGSIIKAAIDNTVSNSGPAGDQEGPLLIDTATGAFTASVDLAASLTDWPITIGDLFTLLVDTGAADALLLPQPGPGTIGQLQVVNQFGTDRSGTVHFDYATGDYTIQNIRRLFDGDTVCNKLYYYLGQRIGKQHWRGNITGSETGAAPGSEDLTAYEALQIASRAKYGTYMDIRVFDDTDLENDARPLYHQLWKEEVRLRVKPRELLYITPVSNCAFEPFDSYYVGDIVAVNSANIVGPAFTGNQRIYGFDCDIDTDGVERVGELICSPDGI